jgi:hypothetical protein
MSHSWPRGLRFSHQILMLQDRLCTACGGGTHVRDFKDRRLFTLSGPLLLQNQMASCIDRRCPGSKKLMSAKEEVLIAPPRWKLAWDAFAYIGQRRFARHWSVPEIREDLRESFDIELSEDAIEDYIGRYQAILAARQRDPVQLEKAYRKVKKVILSIDGLQPEKGHEALYTVRELNAKRVWFATPLISAYRTTCRTYGRSMRPWTLQMGKRRSARTSSWRSRADWRTTLIQSARRWVGSWAASDPDSSLEEISSTSCVTTWTSSDGFDCPSLTSEKSTGDNMQEAGSSRKDPVSCSPWTLTSRIRVLSRKENSNPTWARCLRQRSSKPSNEERR